jgi:hypothetical protein
VLATTIPRWELFAQSFGGPVTGASKTAFGALADELAKRAGEAL